MSNSTAPLQDASVGKSASGSCWVAVAIGFLLLLAIGLVFVQSAGHPFVNYDDPDYVSANQHVLGGPTLDALGWAFAHRHGNNWHPLTSMSHMIDCGIFGAWAGGHHATNVLLHLAVSVALFFVLRKATGHIWPSAFAAALFAIHPMHVESVAWISERKDVLSGLCFMLTVTAYLSFARRPFSIVRYFPVALFFTLGLMAKPMLVTLPIVLLLLDYWPLGRFQRATGTDSPAEDVQRPQATKFPWLLVWEKAPLLAIAAAVSLATVWIQRDFALPLSVLPPTYRVAHAMVSYVAYLRQTFWPAGLAAFYPYPEKGDSLAAAMVAGGLLAGISLLAVSWRRKCPYFLVGWLWYLIMLLPVIGFVQVGLQSMADRYTYLPSIGLFIATAWGGSTFSMARRWRGWVLGSLAGLALALLTATANIQASYWRSSESLWRHAILCTTRNACALANLADALRDQNCFSQAAESYAQSLEINPKYPEGYDHLVFCLCKAGKLDPFIKEYCLALKAGRGDLLLCRNLGLSLVRANQVDEAVELWQEELKRPTPDELAILNDIAWLRATHPDKAVRDGPEAVKLARQAVQKTRRTGPGNTRYPGCRVC